MRRLLLLLCVGAGILLTQGTRGDPPRTAAKDAAPLKAAMPVGNWKVVFSNGVTEECNIGNGGECNVADPGWRSVGMAEVKGGSIVITYGHDRVERWTPVGNRCVVEHWYPASKLPTVTPVLGIADLIQ